MNICCLALYLCFLLQVQLMFAMDGKHTTCMLSGTTRKRGLPHQYIPGSEILMLAVEDIQKPLILPFSKEQFILAKKLLENEYILERSIENDQQFLRSKKKIKKLLLENSIKQKKRATKEQRALIKKAPKEVAMIAGYLGMPRLLTAFVRYASENPVYSNIALPKSMDAHFAYQLMMLNPNVVDHIADYGLCSEQFHEKALDAAPSWFYKNIDPKMALIPFPDGTISIEAVNGDCDLSISYLGKDHTQDFLVKNISDPHDGNSIVTVGVRRDGKQFASMDTYCICIWDAYSGDFVRGFKNKHAISAFAFAHTKPVIVVTTAGSKLVFYNVDNGSRKMASFNSCHDLPFDLDFAVFRREAMALDYTPDDRRLAVAFRDDTIKIYSTESLHLLNTIKHDIFSLTQICFSDDGESLGFATNTEFGVFEPTERSHAGIKELLQKGLTFEESKFVVTAYRAWKNKKQFELQLTQNKQLLKLFIDLPEELKTPVEQSCVVRLPYSYCIQRFAEEHKQYLAAASLASLFVGYNYFFK